MKLLVITNDPVQGSGLADTLNASGHLVVRAWSAGDALLLARNDSPTLAIIDQCHGDDFEALKLAGYLCDKEVDVLWLGDAPESLTNTSNALIATLPPPCDPASVTSAVEALAKKRAGAQTPSPLRLA